MAQHFFNCVPLLISAIFGNLCLVEVPDTFNNYNFHSFRSSSLGSLQTLDNAQGKSCFDVLSCFDVQLQWNHTHAKFPSQISTSAEEKLGKSEWRGGCTGSWALCLLCFSSTSNTAYLRQSLHWWILSGLQMNFLVQWDRAFRQKGCSAVG